MPEKSITTVPFSPHGPLVTRVGLGGEGILRTLGRDQAARLVIREALAQGITYFDSARVYADSEVYYGSVWKAQPESRARVFQASKSASRDKKSALADLDQTLRRLQVSSLDLWQIHDVRTEEDLQIISAPGGALEAFVEAKAAGKTRFIGVTGHHDPRILTQAVWDWPLDSVMMPVNPAEGVLEDGFLRTTLPAARDKGLAVIGMKILGASHYVLPEEGITAEELLRYALAQEITVAIVGCSLAREVQVLSAVGQKQPPMSPEEQAALVEAFRPHAKRLCFYRIPC